jgi:hypothetical protein
MAPATLRPLRPALVAVVSLAVVTTAAVGYAATVVQRQLDAAGQTACHDPNVCYPRGGARTAVLWMELSAAFVPPLIGLILGVALFAGRSTVQPADRRRWVLHRFGWALAAGLACSALVALTHRLVATRYTALAGDTYELLQLLHLNNVGFMLAQTALLIALGGVLRLSTGSTLRTAVLTVVGGPFAVMIAAGVAVLLSALVLPGTGGAGDSPGSFTSDLYVLDPLAYLTSGVAAAGVAALVWLALRIATGRSARA